MSAKPSTIANWATTGAVTVPSAGKQALGFTVGESPPAEYFNWLHLTAAQWQQYLSDGNLTGAHTFNSTVGITGLLTASGGITVPTGQAVNLNGTASLNVAGASTQAAITASGLITANAGVTAGANQNVAVSGTGQYKHGDKVRSVHAITGQATLTSSTPPASWTKGGTGVQHRMSSTSLATSGAMGVGIPVEVGERVKSLRIMMNGNASANVTIQVYVTSASSISGTLIGSVTLSALSATFAPQTIALTNTTIATDQALQVSFDASAAGIDVQTLQLTYDRP